MSDTTVVEQEPVETPAQLPADSPIGTAPASADDLDSLLAEFDAVTDKSAEPPAPVQDGAPALDADVEALLREWSPSPDQQKITALEGELNSVRAAELERQSRADFEGFSRKLQSDLGPHVPEDYARTQLLAMAVENPALEHAWRHRHVTDEQLRAADREFKQLEILYRQVQQAPADERKPAALAQIEARSWELGLMLQSRHLLNRAWNDVRKIASKVAPPIDQDATDLRADIAFQMKQGQGPIDIREPAPAFHLMSDREFNDWVRKNVK